jgi:hypothetical protein
MFGPNLNGDEPHWIIALVFGIAMLGGFIGLPAYIIYTLH